MARRNLDMLPLLDVFMVVLFVFATIQEGQLDDSIQEVEELEAKLVEAQAIAAAQSARAAVLEAELEVEAANQREQLELEAEVAAYQQACGPRTPDGPLCPAAKPEGREQAEVAALHQQLLANVAMFEIEIGGEIRGDQLLNHCCVRADPPQGEWQRCGVVPPDEATRGDWFDDGGEGLRELLRETRDGYAIVLVQQDKGAGYQVSKDLSRLLHDRLREHYVYDLGLSEGPLKCPLFPHSPSSRPE